MGLRERQAYAHRRSGNFQLCHDCKKTDEEVDLFLPPDDFVWQYSYCYDCYMDRHGQAPRGSEGPIPPPYPEYDPYDLDA